MRCQIHRIGWLGIAMLIAMGCAPEKPSDAVAMKDLEIEAGDDSLEDPQAVVARIDGEEITREEFELRLNGLAEFARVRVQAADDREDFLRRIAEFELLADVAERGGYGSSVEVRHAMKETMVALMVEDHLRSEVSISDIDEQALREYYEANKDEFHRSERRQLIRVFVEDEERAEELKQRWLEKVEDFEEPAIEFRRYAFYHSKDRATGDQGGMVGWFETGSEEVPREEIFEWEPEVAMGPIEFDGGFALEMIIDVEPKVQPSFEELEQVLTERVYAKRRDEARRLLVEGLTADADVEVWDEGVAELDEQRPSTTDIPLRLQDIPLQPKAQDH